MRSSIMLQYLVKIAEYLWIFAQKHWKGMDKILWYVVSSRKKLRKYPWMRIAVAVGVLVALVGAFVSIPRPGVHAASGDWPTFLASVERHGFNGDETIINPSSSPNLQVQWTRQVGGPITAEPVEANGLIYWGSWDGIEHATDPTTHTDVWAAQLGQTSSCYPTPIGIASTVTVGTVLIDGTATSVAFVGGGDAQLYALDALSGAVLWHTPLGSSPNHFIWSSPALFNGKVYIGVSSFDDCPLIQGKMFQIDASTGAILHTFNTIPTGCVGASIWGSPAVDQVNGLIIFATGNANPTKCSQPIPYAEAIVALHANDLSLAGSWQPPLTYDSDFGSTPTLFQATINGIQRQMVGIINKNGRYYALDRTNLSAGPLWQARIAHSGTAPDQGKGSISSSSYDGSRLYVAGTMKTINQVTCGGTIQALNPNTGKILWRVCLNNAVLAPVVGVPGVVIVGEGPDMLVFDAGTGKQLFDYHDHANANFWGAASISNGVLYIGSMDGTLYAFGP